MSTDENENNKSEKPAESEANSTIENISEKIEEKTNEVEESIDEAMDDAKKGAGSALKSVMALKDSNPKVFFGGIGAVVLVLLVLMMSGGGSKPELPVHQSANITTGQNYILQGANITAEEATIRLVAAPGSTAAYDDTEESDRVGGCKHMPQGTPVKVLQTQDAYGKKDVFVQVEMTAGECAGQKGWVLAVNLK